MQSTIPTASLAGMRRRGWLWGLAAMVALLAGIGYWLHVRSLHASLLREWPEELAGRPPLVRMAVRLARPLYAEHCAACHGANLGGNRALGAPNLADPVWLYGDGSIGDIENTILYGIRSGHPKSHNVTDMPAEGRTHQLSATEIEDVVDFVLALSRQPHDAAAAERGRKLFYDRGNCFDCHAGDAMGNPDYGSPALLGKTWNYGGDRLTLRQSIYSGRHGLCPAWIFKLTPLQIRALAVYLYVESRPQARLARQ